MGHARFGPGGNSESFFAEGHKNTKEAPAWVAAKGLDAYEYEAGRGIMGGEAHFREVGEEAAKAGIALSLHAPYFISLSGIEESTRMKSLGYIEQSVRAASWMGADVIVIHAGSAGKISREEALALACDTLAKTVEAGLGDFGVRLGIETMGKKNQLGTLEEVLAMCKVAPCFCPVIDFGHMEARECGGVFRSADDYRRVFARIGEELGASYLDGLHCHFSRIEHGPGGEKRHLTFADTAFGPDFLPLAEAIAKDGLSPRIICESDGTMAEDACFMRDRVAERR